MTIAQAEEIVSWLFGGRSGSIRYTIDDVSKALDVINRK